VLVLSNVVLINKNERAPITITSYVSVARMSLDDLISQADLIVIGEFTSFRPGRWSTPNGELPESATLESVSRQHLVIFTDVDFHADQFLKADRNSPILRVRIFGGQAGQDSMIISSEPTITAGKTYLLFLYQDTGSTASIDPGDFLILGGIQGTYEIMGNEAISADDKWVLEDLVIYIQNALQSSQ
jgi:hypothetical protein